MKEWTGRLHAMVAECDYKEYGGKLSEQFIHGQDDKGTASEIVR